MTPKAHPELAGCPRGASRVRYASFTPRAPTPHPNAANAPRDRRRPGRKRRDGGGVLREVAPPRARAERRSANAAPPKNDASAPRTNAPLRRPPRPEPRALAHHAAGSADAASSETSSGCDIPATAPPWLAALRAQATSAGESAAAASACVAAAAAAAASISLPFASRPSRRRESNPAPTAIPYAGSAARRPRAERERRARRQKTPPRRDRTRRRRGARGSAGGRRIERERDGGGSNARARDARGRRAGDPPQKNPGDAIEERRRVVSFRAARRRRRRCPRIRPGRRTSAEARGERLDAPRRGRRRGRRGPVAALFIYFFVSVSPRWKHDARSAFSRGPLFSGRARAPRAPPPPPPPPSSPPPRRRPGPPRRRRGRSGYTRVCTIVRGERRRERRADVLRGRRREKNPSLAPPPRGAQLGRHLPVPPAPEHGDERDAALDQSRSTSARCLARLELGVQPPHRGLRRRGGVPVRRRQRHRRDGSFFHLEKRRRRGGVSRVFLLPRRAARTPRRTMPPMECPRRTTCVPGGYAARIRSSAADANAIWRRSDAAWNAPSSSPKSSANQSNAGGGGGAGAGAGSGETPRVRDSGGGDAISVLALAGVGRRSSARAARSRTRRSCILAVSDATLRTWRKLPPLPGKNTAGIAVGAPGAVGAPSAASVLAGSSSGARACAERSR